MANEHNGEVAFNAGGERHILSFSANAICDIEGELKIEISELIETMNSGKIKLAFLRTIFWLGLLDHQPDTSFDQAKGILKKLKPHEMGELIGKAFILSMPEPEGKAAPHPQKPGGLGNGLDSSTPGLSAD